MLPGYGALVLSVLCNGFVPSLEGNDVTALAVVGKRPDPSFGHVVSARKRVTEDAKMVLSEITRVQKALQVDYLSLDCRHARAARASGHRHESCASWNGFDR